MGWRWLIKIRASDRGADLCRFSRGGKAAGVFKMRIERDKKVWEKS